MSDLTTSLKDRVIIGAQPTKTFYNYSNLTSTVNGNYYTYGYRVAILGDANVSASSSTSNVGVLGLTGSSNGSDTNFGVWGRIASSTKGTAIMGSCDNISGPSIYGTYAGYFRGPVYVYGTLTATSVVTSSDKELKENISPLVSDDDRNESALEKIMAMNAVKYNFKPLTSVESEKDMENTDDSSKDILDSKIYLGNNIYVGKAVNQNEQQGEVVFRSGSETTLKGSTVKLDKGTIIELGAKVSINH